MSDLYNSIEELMLELEDEDGDPVGGRTLAIVPGAFKPPHLGHLSMVKQYASEADEVVVLISSPLNLFAAKTPTWAPMTEERIRKNCRRFK